MREESCRWYRKCVQVAEVQSELLPLTSMALADICRVPLPLAELRTAVSGLTVMLASEFGETKKPPQPIINPATTTRADKSENCPADSRHSSP